MPLPIQCLSAIAMLFAPANAVEKSAVYEAQAVAYFEALITADVEKADKLVTVPYSLDRKKVLKSLDEVKEIHQAIAKNKGKRPVPKYTIGKTDKAPALDAAVFPKYVVYRMSIEKEHVDVYLTVEDAPKVIGISD
jgi:hypothetical protein